MPSRTSEVDGSKPESKILSAACAALADGEAPADRLAEALDVDVELGLGLAAADADAVEDDDGDAAAVASVSSFQGCQT